MALKALIDPRHNRVCQLEPPTRVFEIAAPLTWADVPTEIEFTITTHWTYDGTRFIPPPPPPPPGPDRRGFERALKTIFPDDLLTLRKVLVLFWLVEHEEWPRLEKAILAAKAAGEITSGSPTAQYERIKAEAAAKRIPVTLP